MLAANPLVEILPLTPDVEMAALAPVVVIAPVDVTLEAPTSAKFAPPVASRKTTVLGVAAVAPAVAPLTFVPFAAINPVRFDAVAVVMEFSPVGPVGPTGPAGPFKDICRSLPPATLSCSSSLPVTLRLYLGVSLMTIVLDIIRC